MNRNHTSGWTPGSVLPGKLPMPTPTPLPHPMPMPPSIQPPIAQPPVIQPPAIPCEDMVLVMSYVKMQQWDQTYEAETGLERGTIFPELDLPFVGEGACPDD